MAQTAPASTAPATQPPQRTATRVQRPKTTTSRTTKPAAATAALQQQQPVSVAPPPTPPPPTLRVFPAEFRELCRNTQRGVTDQVPWSEARGAGDRFVQRLQTAGASINAGTAHEEEVWGERGTPGFSSSLFLC